MIQAAEALEAADELEEIERARSPRTLRRPPPRSSTASRRRPRDRPRRKPSPQGAERKEPRRERKPAPERKRKEPRQRGRVVNFLVQVWAELRRVQWPDRNQVTQATGVVVVFCFLAGAYPGVLGLRLQQARHVNPLTG